jgi:hypothetical protein
MRTSLKDIFQREDFKRTRKNSRYKLQNNTWIVKLEDGYAIQLHNTYVYSEFNNGDIRISTGGWRTHTTKNRIDQYSKLRIISNKGEWVVGESLLDFDEINGKRIKLEILPLGNYDMIYLVNGKVVDIRFSSHENYENSLWYTLEGGFGTQKRKKSFEKALMLHDLRTKEVLK